MNGIGGLESNPPVVTQALASEWTKWSDQRTPNERGPFRFRAAFQFLGLPVTAEWTEEQCLCGMGYSESECRPQPPSRVRGMKPLPIDDRRVGKLAEACALIDDERPRGKNWKARHSAAYAALKRGVETAISNAKDHSA